MPSTIMYLLVVFCAYLPGVIHVSVAERIYTPPHFYNIGSKRASILRDSDTHGDFNLDTPIRFLGKYMCQQNGDECVDPQRLVVNKNGVISFGRERNVMPYRPSNGTRLDIIAPLWSWLSYGRRTGQVFYRQIKKNRFRKQVTADIQAVFPCANRTNFKAKEILMATWYNMPYDSCTDFEPSWPTSEVDGYCTCLHDYPEYFCSPVNCQHQICHDQTLEEFCGCAVDKGPGRCPCNGCHSALDQWSWFEEEEIVRYCHCILRFPQDVCDCFTDNGFEDLIGCRCDRTGDSDYCRCTQYYYMDEDYCDCRYHQMNDLDTCQCWERYSQDFCQCLDWYDEYHHSQIDYSHDFCDCYENETSNKTLSSCLCSGDDDQLMSPEYCRCLNHFQPFFDYEGRGRMDTLSLSHSFCLCYEELADAHRCGCYDDIDICNTTPVSTRNVMETKRQRRHLISSRGATGLYAPWSKQHNTFQAMIVIGGHQTYVIFSYSTINILQYMGDKKRPALVGFDGEGDDDHFENKFSFTKRLRKLKSRSNVGVTGRWIYRVDGPTVQEPDDCP